MPTKRRLRRSQAVTTFGPGAIVDLRHESVMMAGVDQWPDEKGVTIHEPNLERVLQIDHFKMPATSDERSGGDGKDLPIVRFPRWMVCPSCHRLGDLRLFSNLGSRDAQIKCPYCRKPVYPARLILACRNGHIEDFPWSWWVHKGNPEVCTRAKPELFLEARGQTASLADVVVKCRSCGAIRNLSGATREVEFAGYHCSGNRPWLGSGEPCDQQVVPLQRGASNVYFSVTASSISIPPWSTATHAALNKHWETLKRASESRLPLYVEDLHLPELLGATVDEIVGAIMARRGGNNAAAGQLSERQLRHMESQALRRETRPTHDQDDFSTREADVHPGLQGLISKVILVERLREVRALRGFSRVDAPDPSTRLQQRLAPISATYRDWLPAIEVRGEGIYLELDEDQIENWQNAHAEVCSRAEMVQERYLEMCKRRQWEESRTITPRFLLAHSFAHALIRQLSLESGYSSASLRERLYVFEAGELDPGSRPRAGILIYTSTSDSEGSLGGLMRQGLPDRLVSTITAAINDASWCSSDPLCIESEGQGHDAMNLAACHACLLLSETCCEEFNRMLDRAMLIGLPENPVIGYFSKLVGG